MVEMLHVQGKKTAESKEYTRRGYDEEIVRRVINRYRIAGTGHIWWIFLYVGDRPTRFQVWWGRGDSRDGGRALVNYDTLPGEISPALSLNEGFNARYFLKGTIHELGHALGLPHTGPDVTLGMGNSLMGANNSVYIARKYPDPEKVYLTSSSAAMLWKHPLFSGNDRERVFQPKVKVADCHIERTEDGDGFTVSGRLISDRSAHSIIVLYDQDRPKDVYWYRSQSARIAADGAFRVTFEKVADSGGMCHVMFCFDNGMVSGDGESVAFGDRGAISLPIPPVGDADDAKTK